jgi:hypothetical protein
MMLEEGSGHLGPASIVDTDEQNLRCHGSFRDTTRYYSLRPHS